jgi:hypothetical protein
MLENPKIIGHPPSMQITQERPGNLSAHVENHDLFRMNVLKRQGIVDEWFPTGKSPSHPFCSEVILGDRIVTERKVGSYPKRNIFIGPDMRLDMASSDVANMTPASVRAIYEATRSVFEFVLTRQEFQVRPHRGILLPGLRREDNGFIFTLFPTEGGVNSSHPLPFSDDRYEIIHRSLSDDVSLFRRRMYSIQTDKRPEPYGVYMELEYLNVMTDEDHRALITQKKYDPALVRTFIRPTIVLT